jgi:hypothetical protein
MAPEADLLLGMRRLLSLPFLLACALALVLVPGAGATTVDPPALPSGTTGTAYSQAISSSTGTAPFTFAVTGGSLPPGLSLAVGGLLSGTPTSSGSFAFTVTATDNAAVSASRAYSLSIAPALIDITPGTVPPASRTTPYSQVLSGSGGTAPYTFAVTAGVLPAGISLSAAGTLSGTAGAIGSYTFTVTATDANSSSAARTYTLNVNVLTLDILPGSLSDTAAGVPYSVVLSGSGGTAPYTFALAPGSTLPPGLALSANGTITGFASAVGQYNFTIKVTDGTAQSTTRTYNLKVVVNAVIVSLASPDGAYGKQYDQFFSSSAGTGPYVYSLNSGTLPTGLQLATTGELYGTPTLAALFSFWITAVDKYGNRGTYPFTVNIVPPTIAMTPDDLFAATSGLFYSVTMNASGGLGTYTYTLASGSLPTGLTLATNGTISGIPNAAPGLFAFSVTATDSYGATGTKLMSLKLATPTLLVTSFALPIATVGATYLQTLSVNGGTAPYTYSLVDGVLPAGLALSPDGKLSGSPTTTGTSTFTVLILDANGVTGKQSFRLVVQTATPAVKKTPPKTKKVVAKKKKSKAKVKVKAKH